MNSKGVTHKNVIYALDSVLEHPCIFITVITYVYPCEPYIM